MSEPEIAVEAADNSAPEPEGLRNARGEVVHLVVESVEGSWLPYDEETAVNRADEVIESLVDSEAYA